jgi:Hemerythrin HHE cation binding domain
MLGGSTARGADRNDAKRRALIGAHAQLLCQILHAHHEGEDLVLWPLLLERAEAEATQIVAAMGKQHQAIAAAHDEAVHRLGDWCRFGRDAEGFATVLDDLVRVLTKHCARREGCASCCREVGVSDLCGLRLAAPDERRE